MPEIASGANVLDSFRRLAELNGYLRGHTSYDSYNVIRERNEVAFAIAEEIVGHRVMVEELPNAREHQDRPPIERWSRAAPAASFTDTRTYWGSNARFLPNDVFRYHKKSRGKAVAVDRDRASLVVRPRITGILDRDWIKVADSDGHPLVKLAVLG